MNAHQRRLMRRREQRAYAAGWHHGQPHYQPSCFPQNTSYTAAYWLPHAELAT